MKTAVRSTQSENPSHSGLILRLLSENNANFFLSSFLIKIYFQIPSSSTVLLQQILPHPLYLGFPPCIRLMKPGTHWGTTYSSLLWRGNIESNSKIINLFLQRFQLKIFLPDKHNCELRVGSCFFSNDHIIPKLYQLHHFPLSFSWPFLFISWFSFKTSLNYLFSLPPPKTLIIVTPPCSFPFLSLTPLWISFKHWCEFTNLRLVVRVKHFFTVPSDYKTYQYSFESGRTWVTVLNVNCTSWGH